MKKVKPYVYSVSLLSYTGSAVLSRGICWALFLSLAFVGTLQLLLARVGVEMGKKC